ncbi:putative wall-associated receptor kinase-like 16 [Vicia villosa]|uniref:putative wall-associated receptor kinase-like 16 n=1 Tax=Vicia villosa TaxID=3911 RepID=UPI00273B0AEF|nr:putative wall-associated receptor kinase-like 16 [Vicia villosa]
MKMMKHVLMINALTMMVGIAALAADTCNDIIHTCGDVEIPYPFAIYNNNPDCFSHRQLLKLYCNKSKIYAGKNLQVLNINISKSQIEWLLDVSKYCGKDNVNNYENTLTTASYTISSKDNKFITVGNNSYGYLNSFSDDGGKYSTGCLTRSFGDPRDIDNGTCSGIGCCQVDIPPRMTNISVQAYNFNKSSESCSYSFVVKNDSYTFSSTHLSKGLPQREFPAVFDWTIGDENCSSAKNNGVNYGCKSNSHCDDKDTYFGYRCKCNPGYEGNPYNPIGCTDIDECEIGPHECKTKENCRNTDGNHTCFCPKGSSGDGTLKGGCQQNLNTIVLPIVLGAGAVFTVLFAGIIFYLLNQKRKLNKLKEKFYKQNGGSILEQKLTQRQDSSQIAHIFKENELRKATNNYDESLIVGRGGFGTVFKGELEDNRIVAIKKSKTIDESQVEQFINEVDVVSRINHRNVVKLLGCCLETEVPLLVYEFVSNGTLSEFIRTEIGKVNNVSWKTRLKIAAEVAGALSYLHSAASVPIIHRDVKSDNILLDETNTAKVSDFGASRLVPLDQIEVATMVQGTIGYLDPEYMQTSQLTEKSDVYSFGVVLVELLTGEKPFCAGRPEERRSFSMYFLSCLKKDSLHEVIHDGMWNEENKQEIKEVSVLAAKCLRLRGEERPSMKEVAMELEGLRLMNKHSWINEDINVEESRYLLHESSSRIDELGDSSKQGDYGYDSLKDHVLIALDDGR